MRQQQTDEKEYQMSSETVATVGLVTYDIYKAYFNRDATNKQLVRVSHITVLLFGFSVAAIAVGFNHAGFSVNFIVTALGIFVDSAIVPMVCTILWKKQSLAAVVLAPIISSVAAIVAWLLTAYTHYGEVTIATTSENLPLVAGNMMSLCGPLVLTPLITYLKPASYDWELLKEIKSDREASGDPVGTTPVIMGRTPGEVGSSGSEPATSSIHDDALDTKLRRARNKACLISVGLCLSFLILWPIPMYGTGYGKEYLAKNGFLQRSTDGSLQQFSRTSSSPAGLSSFSYGHSSPLLLLPLLRSSKAGEAWSAFSDMFLGQSGRVQARMRSINCRVRRIATIFQQGRERKKSKSGSQSETYLGTQAQIWQHSLIYFNVG